MIGIGSLSFLLHFTNVHCTLWNKAHAQSTYKYTRQQKAVVSKCIFLINILDFSTGLLLWISNRNTQFGIRLYRSDAELLVHAALGSGSHGERSEESDTTPVSKRKRAKQSLRQSSRVRVRSKINNIFQNLPSDYWNSVFSTYY